MPCKKPPLLIMSHRFKLLFILSLVGFSIAPHAIANSPLQAKSLAGSDRLPSELTADFIRSTAAIEQRVAASPSASVHASPSPSASPVLASASSSLQNWLWWGAIALLPIAVVAGVLYTLRPKDHKQRAGQQSVKRKKSHSSQSAIDPDSLPDPEADREVDNISPTDKQTDEEQFSSETNGSRSIAPQQTDLTVSATTRLSKIDIVEALIQDLHRSDANQRRKAIWELGQRGDSRAIQPLVDLLIDSDSNQRGLILAAVAEINIRALKPMNRALMLSMQDASPDVRKNAIRDATRVFELVTQTNQLLHYASSDTDADVRKTAEWAIGQLNRARPLTGIEEMSSLTHHLTPRHISLPHLSALTESTCAEITHVEIIVDSPERTEPLREE